MSLRSSRCRETPLCRSMRTVAPHTKALSESQEPKLLLRIGSFFKLPRPWNGKARYSALPAVAFAQARVRRHRPVEPSLGHACIPVSGGLETAEADGPPLNARSESGFASPGACAAWACLAVSAGSHPSTVPPYAHRASWFRDHGCRTGTEPLLRPKPHHRCAGERLGGDARPCLASYGEAATKMLILLVQRTL